MRDLSERLIAAVCRAVADRLDGRVIPRGDGGPYLERRYVFHREWLPVKLREKARGVYLHFFHSSDADEELHNHAWADSWSFILTGGYIEERRVETEHGDKIVTRTLRPGSLNRLRADDYHKITLLDPARGCWTLFIAGDPIQQWGFWHPVTKRYLPWFEHEARVRERARQRKEQPWSNDHNRYLIDPV